MIWPVLLAITAVALTGLLLPAMRRGRETASRATLELAIYNDQLTEVQREVERGLLTPAEAKAAETEISRHMLTASKARKTETGKSGAKRKGGSRARTLVLASMATLVSLGALGVYFVVGAPAEPNYPFAAREADHDGNPNMVAAIQKLTERLQREPDDLEGWILLARSAVMMELYEDAARAYRRAWDLAGERSDLALAYASTLVAASRGMVTPEARAIFEKMQRDAVPDPRVRYYLGLAKVQSGESRAAMEIWLDLEADAPPGAPWLPDVRAGIERLAAESGIDPETIAPGRTLAARAPGPSAEDMAAAQDMSSGEQLEMIRGMVERLATRLEQQPDDIEGWLRLARAYQVLGERQQAEEAVQSADKAATSPEQRALVQQAAQDLDVSIK